MSPISSAGLVCGIVLLVTPALIRLLRRLGVVDHPNDRSSHHVGTPRGAGLGLAVGILAGLSLVGGLGGPTRTGAMAAAIGFGLIGLVDDLKDVPALPRLGAQVVVAGLVLAWLLDGLSGPAPWVVVFSAGCLVWLVAYVNAFNFMDGINALAASQVLVAGVTWWALGRTQGVPPLEGGGAIVAGAALGFLPYNYPRALVFLGDVGSYLLGGLLAALIIIGLRAGLPFEATLGPVAIYLADTGVTLVRRVRAGEVWYLPHRTHVYQRLTRLGWSQARTTAVVSLVMAACSGLGALSITGSVPLRAAGDAVLATVLVLYVLSPTLLEGRLKGRSALPTASVLGDRKRG